MKSEVVIRIVDDNKEQRDALRFLLESVGYQVADYESAKSFLQNDASSVPGCCILDLQMPEMDGLSLLSILKERDYEIPIIFLSAHGNIPAVVEAMKLGTIDFLEKPVDFPKLCQLLNEVVTRQMKSRNIGLSQIEARQKVDKLSSRRLSVARLLVKGLLKREIAERLGINIKTVESHSQMIYSMLDVHSVKELAELLYQAGVNE